MSDSDDDAPEVTVKGKTIDGRTSYSQYKPKGVLRKQTCRKSTGGASPRIVTVGKYRKPTDETVLKDNGDSKRIKLTNSKENDESESDSGEDLSDNEEDGISDDSIQELTKTKTLINLVDEEGDVDDSDDDDDVDDESDEDDVEPEDEPEEEKTDSKSATTK